MHRVAGSPPVLGAATTIAGTRAHLAAYSATRVLVSLERSGNVVAAVVTP